MIGFWAIAFFGAEDTLTTRRGSTSTTKPSLVTCHRYGMLSRLKDRSSVELVDLPVFGVQHGLCGTCAD